MIAGSDLIVRAFLACGWRLRLPVGRPTNTKDQPPSTGFATLLLGVVVRPGTHFYLTDVSVRQCVVWLRQPRTTSTPDSTKPGRVVAHWQSSTPNGDGCGFESRPTHIMITMWPTKRMQTLGRTVIFFASRYDGEEVAPRAPPDEGTWTRHTVAERR